MEPLESVLCGRRLPPSRPKGGRPWGLRVVWPLVGTRAMHIVPDARWARNLLAVLHLRPSRLAIIISPWGFGPALTSYCTYRRTSNFPQTVPIVRSRFSDGAHYNEFVESGAKSRALMRRRLVLEIKGTQNRKAQRPREKRPLARGRECANPSWSRRSLPPISGPPTSFLSCEISVVIYHSLLFILLLHLSVIHAHPRVHVLSTILSGTLWVVMAPIVLSRGHIHINGIRMSPVGI